MNRITAISKNIKSGADTKNRLIKRSKDYSSAHVAPALFGIAGLTLVDAASLGLGAISLLAPSISKSGNLAITSEKAERLLTPQARRRLQNTPSNAYTAPLFWIHQDRAGTATAKLEVVWEGNNYGEIGTAYVRRNMQHTTDFTKSSLTANFMKINKIPSGRIKDPREWPITFAYDGSFDPMGNGQFEFQGEFEINAFGGFKFNRHIVKSVSLADWALTQDPYEVVKKYQDKGYRVPPLPADQRQYLLENLP